MKAFETRTRKFQLYALIPIVLVLFLSTEVHAASFLWDYLRQYQLGIEKSYVIDGALITYSTSKNSDDLGSNCRENPEKEGYNLCSVNLVINQSSGYSLYLQRAFKRKGLFYVNADFGLSFRSYEGKLDSDQVDEALPLKRLDFYFYGIVFRPYFQLGITPSKFWPDLIISFGPVFQWLWGGVTINSERSETGWAGAFNFTGLKNLRAYNEIELVLWRYQEGAFSIFWSYISGNNAVQLGRFFPEEVDNMSDFVVDFNRNSYGIKMLLNWP